MGSECNINDHTSNISFQTPKFFKIILQDTIQEQRLAIPKKFVLMYEHCLSNRIILKLPDGKEWEMELSKSENHEAWLQKGWKEFSDYYSLKLASMLVFEYRDESSFNVFIFDATLVEIEYPKKPNLERNGSQLDGLRDAESGDSDSKNLEIGGKCSRTYSQSLEAAEKFRSTRPWFKVVVKSKRGVRRSLDVPIEYVQDHTEGSAHALFLMVEGNKRCWPIKLNVFWRKNRAQFTSGWPAFFNDNCLKYRDVCVFELVATKVLKVHIFRHAPSDGS